MEYPKGYSATVSLACQSIGKVSGVEPEIIISHLDCLQSVSLSFLYRNKTRKEHTGREIRNG